MAAGLAGFILAWAQVVEAQVTTYSDRSAWIAAASGSVQTEDFNSFAADTTFKTAVIPLLNMTITQLEGDASNPANFIDVFPHEEEGKRSIDGTTYVLADVRDDGTRIRIQFTEPVTGWGADFVSHDGLTVIDLFDQFGNPFGTTANVAAEDTFYGFHLGPGQSAAEIQLTFTGVTNDRFGMDNFSFAGSAAPPNPVSLTTSLVTSVNAIPALNPGQAGSLVAKLDTVLAFLSGQRPGQGAGNPPAVRMLNSFVLQVQALMSSGSLSASVGQALITDAAVVAALLQ
jgi:hypothetical protein